jgi:hypothetical protein
VSLDTFTPKIPRLVMLAESLTPVFVAPAVTPSFSTFEHLLFTSLLYRYCDGRTHWN